MRVRGFGPLEAAVMDVLWSSPAPLYVREVRQALPERELAYTTVMTVLDKLYKKGWARRERHGRAYRYHPASSRESYTAQLMTDALSSGGDRAATLVHFVEQMTPGETAALRVALAGHLPGVPGGGPSEPDAEQPDEAAPAGAPS